jgi:hypothetical protein
VHGVIAAGASSSAWNFGSSILTFAFPMILFVAIAAGQLASASQAETEEGA